jgi:predicted RNA binding protein YcfA (HicA-like mRNA interferase family)
LSKLPVISGDKLIKLLMSLGYKIVRQKGSHVRLRKITEAGEHNITVPKHSEIARGTLNDILSKISIWNNMPKEQLIDLLKRM